MKAKAIVLIGMMGSLLFTMQVALYFLPNVELVTLFIILFTLIFKKKTIFIIYVFVLLEGFMYGFGLWWFGYLYVWTILYFITVSLNKLTSPLSWAITSAGFGLSFGALFSIPYFITGGIALGGSYWISGIPYDLIHGISNFVLMFALYKPLYMILDKSNKQYERM